MITLLTSQICMFICSVSQRHFFGKPTPEKQLIKIWLNKHWIFSWVLYKLMYNVLSYRTRFWKFTSYFWYPNFITNLLRFFCSLDHWTLSVPGLWLWKSFLFKFEFKIKHWTYMQLGTFWTYMRLWLCIFIFYKFILAYSNLKCSVEQEYTYTHTYT